MLAKYYINQPENEGGTVYLHPNCFSECVCVRVLALYSKVCRKQLLLEQRK